MCVITGITLSGVLTAVTAATMAASTAMGVISSVQQGKAAEAQANYQAAVAKRNAEIAQANADQKRQEGIEESRMQRMKTAQRVGLQQTALAANGIDTSSGTALDIIEDTQAMGELDALTTMYNSESQALALERQADNFNNQSNLDIISGQNAYRASMTNALTTGLKGLGDVSSVASKWYGNNDNTFGLKSVKARRISGGVYGDNITFA